MYFVLIMMEKRKSKLEEVILTKNTILHIAILENCQKNGELVEFDLGFWNATDLVSGMIMAKGNTKKECIENAIKNIPMVNEAWRSKQAYGDLVEEFKRLKAEKGIFN